MQLATILPTKYLPLIADERYHMSLAHLIGEDKEYTDFYRDQVARGSYVIMDNGVIEDAQQSIEDICEKARLVGAQEIILPDVFQDMENTVAKSWEALEYVRTHCPELKVMVVPQGKDIEEWVACLQEMITWNIDAIGIPKVLSTYEGVGNLERGTILSLIKPIIDDYNEWHKRKVDIHLLGCWNSPLELTIIEKLVEQGKLPEVRGCDSAIAYAFADQGLKLGACERIQGKPINFADTEADMELLYDNICKWMNSVDMTVSKVVDLK